jgi:hypothetical protein
MADGNIRVAPGNLPVLIARRRAAGLGRTGIGHRGRAGELNPGAGLSFGGILKGIGKTVGGFLTGGPAGAVTGLVSSLGGGGGGGQSFAPAGQCPSGFTFRNGRCEATGLSGFGQRMIPGGRTGLLPQAGAPGEAVMGGFGIPAMLPQEVGEIMRTDGSVGPILRCIPGLVLGKDDLCYPRAILGRRSRYRKHKLAPRPPISGADAQAIRRAARTKDRVKRLAGEVGFTCKKR